jgi:hypothetical protein
MNRFRRWVSSNSGSTILAFAGGNAIFGGAGFLFSPLITLKYLPLYWCLIFIAGNICGIIAFLVVSQDSSSDSKSKIALWGACYPINLGIYALEGFILIFLFNSGMFLSLLVEFTGIFCLGILQLMLCNPLT